MKKALKIGTIIVAATGVGAASSCQDPETVANTRALIAALKSAVCDTLPKDHPARVRIRENLAKAPTAVIWAQAAGINPYCPDTLAPPK